jgi:hypothetical protein
LSCQQGAITDRLSGNEGRYLFAGGCCGSADRASRAW